METHCQKPRTLSTAHAEELFARFFLNAPQEMLSTPLDFCILLENAFYYYHDYMIHQRASPKAFKNFAKIFLKKIPEFSNLVPEIDSLIKIHENHRFSSNAAGCILYNSSLTRVIVVHHAIKPNFFSFPKGKMVEGESYIEVAAREVLEETGIDVSGLINDDLTFTYSREKGSIVHMFHVLGIPDDTKLETPSPLEICKVRWVNIENIGKEKDYYPDNPTQKMLPQIKSFIASQKENL
ncbi:m7GpppN-mRNA hydrolase [Histomonas meleagridis]|uniref:m7GpppN-mRNA hydrolase n=1 Tax=Histomonas meleagridis TaxID=135588 RepID=UPI00355994A1|nr:m7GpppN-mRNA hydrolase [Histomonas meleagridis]KAH0799028.1 m7GpppN-mRNA hydrolase [Histomonas meleagridis]